MQSEPSLRNYHLLSRVRGDFPAKLIRHQEPRAEFERAALTQKHRSGPRSWIGPRRPDS